MFFRIIKKRLPVLVTVALLVVTGTFNNTVKADSGTTYTCRINPSYAHPVTGDVEDAGGKSSMATGQGMVEGVISTTGMLEVTDSGKYYLTIRMSLMDFTSNQSFKVQRPGESSWRDAKIGITSKGTDNNGTTADVCIEVPDKDCIVRGTMYVNPMGRDVIYYFYPDNFKSGKPDGMKATMVTKKSAKGDNKISSTNETVTESNEKKEENVTENGSRNGETQVQGLSLSTNQKVTDSSQETNSKSSGSGSMGQQIFVLTISITMAGLILICAAVVAIYFCRKNWNRWGGDMFED